MKKVIPGTDGRKRLPRNSRWWLESTKSDRFDRDGGSAPARRRACISEFRPLADFNSALHSVTVPLLNEPGLSPF